MELLLEPLKYLCVLTTLCHIFGPQQCVDVPEDEYLHKIQLSSRIHVATLKLFLL